MGKASHDTGALWKLICTICQRDVPKAPVFLLAVVKLCAHVNQQNDPCKSVSVNTYDTETVQEIWVDDGCWLIEGLETAVPTVSVTQTVQEPSALISEPEHRRAQIMPTSYNVKKLSRAFGPSESLPNENERVQAAVAYNTPPPSTRPKQAVKRSKENVDTKTDIDDWEP